MYTSHTSLIGLRQKEKYVEKCDFCFVLSQERSRTPTFIEVLIVLHLTGICGREFGNRRS